MLQAKPEGRSVLKGGAAAVLTGAGLGRPAFLNPLSELLHSPLWGIFPPAQVLPRFRCRIGATLEIFAADYALRWVSIELGVGERLVRQSKAGIVPGVLRFLQRTSARDDPGPQRGPADGRLAAYVKLSAAHVAALVDLLQGEPCGVVAGFRRMCWRVLRRKECVGGRPGCFRYHRPHQPQADGYHQALQREHEPREPDHLVLSAVIDGLLRILYSTFRFYPLVALLWREVQYCRSDEEFDRVRRRAT